MTVPDRTTGLLDGVLAAATPIRLGDAVIDELTQAIVDGRLKPGDPLPSEGRIAAAFGVSKQIAREAIRDLAAMGVLQVQQGKVSRVRALDAEPLSRFYRFAVGGSGAGLAAAIELRRILEPPVAALAATRRSGAGLLRFRQVLERLEASVGDVPAWIEADLDFHEGVAALAGNPLMLLQVRGLRPVIREVMEIFNSRADRGPGEWRATFDRHARVLSAIADGDGAGAADAMSRHFEAADEAIRELFPER